MAEDLIQSAKDFVLTAKDMSVGTALRRSVDLGERCYERQSQLDPNDPEAQALDNAMTEIAQAMHLRFRLFDLTKARQKRDAARSERVVRRAGRYR